MVVACRARDASPDESARTLEPFRRMSNFVDPAEKGIVSDLSMIRMEKMDLDVHYSLQGVLRRWLVSYSSTYGGLGIVMAILFWLIAAATVMMFAAALSPAVAARRAAVRAGAAGSANGLPGGAG